MAQRPLLGARITSINVWYRPKADAEKSISGWLSTGLKGAAIAAAIVCGRRISYCPLSQSTLELELEHFISTYGVWLVAAFIALESIGAPLPAEAALMAAAVFAGTTHGLDIWLLIPVGIVAAIAGNIVGFWIGRRYGHQLLTQHGHRVRLTKGRISIGQYLFLRYGGKLVFVARFLPILRNTAAVLAGANCMPQRRFYFASATAAAIWVLFHGLTAYFFGEAYTQMASPAAVALGIAALLIFLGVPALILRYEKRLQAEADRVLALPPTSP